MSEYTPDNFVIIKLDDGKDPHYRVLAGWSGGYLTGDSWRLNSGITRHEFDDDELVEELTERGYFVSKEEIHASFDMEDWKLLLEIVDAVPETVYTRRVREKLMNQRWG